MKNSFVALKVLFSVKVINYVNCLERVLASDASAFFK